MLTLAYTGYLRAFSGSQLSARLLRATPLFHHCIDSFLGPQIDLPWPCYLLLGVRKHFVPLSDPPGGTRDGKKHGKHLHRKSHRLVDNARIKIDIWVELALDKILVLQGNPLKLQGNIK